MSETNHDPQIHSELSRELTLFHITMMGLGMMIGAGVFIGIGNTIAEAGPGGLILTFALNGLIALFTAMSFAELSSAIPRAGGAYNFARLGFGRGTSFVTGWMEWFASSVAGSLYAVVFGTYTLEFLLRVGWLGWLPGVPDVITMETSVPTYAVRVVAFLIAIVFIYINYRGSSETGKVGAFFTLGQMAFVLCIAAIGIATAIKDPSRLANFTPFMPHGWGKLLMTMGFIYVAFEGFEVIAQAGDETIDPRRNIPKAMLYSVLIVTLTYILVSFGTVVAIKAGTPELGGEAPWEWIGKYKDTGFGQAVALLMPSKFVGYLVVTLAVIFSSTSALNATVFSATRSSYALGRDRMLPSMFAAISKKRRTPWFALMATGVIVLIVATVLPTKDVASSASIMFLALFFTVNVCVIKIRRNMGDELSYGYLMPLFPLPAILAIVAQVILAIWLVHMSLLAWIIAPCWIVCGILLYRFYSKSRAVATDDEIRILEEEQGEVAREGYRVMLPVANPDNALSMVRTAYLLCGTKPDSHVELLHMVPVPDQMPLHAAEDYMREGREAIGETMLYLAPQFPLSTTLRYCRNVARGIVSAVREKRTNLLIMGWHGRRTSGPFALGSTVDPVIERVPCDVAILKDCGNLKPEHILVPVAGGPNSRLAFSVAASLAAAKGGRLTVMTVRTDPTRPAFDVSELVGNDPLPEGFSAESIRLSVVESSDVREAILEEAHRDDSPYDLVVMGCTGKPLMVQFARRSVPESVAEDCGCPLIMVRAGGGLRSWIRRWL